jgi:uncharacterized protein YjbI with pentapeptide repeats
MDKKICLTLFTLGAWLLSANSFATESCQVNAAKNKAPNTKNCQYLHQDFSNSYLHDRNFDGATIMNSTFDRVDLSHS